MSSNLEPNGEKPAFEPGYQEALLEADPSQPLSDEAPLAADGHKIAGQAGVVGSITLLSRIFGLARDSAIAYILGTQAGADAFYVAYRIPNLLRRMFAEGNLTLSFIPVFTKASRLGKAEAKSVVDVTFTVLFFLMLAISVVGVLGAAWFVKITASGFSREPEKFWLTVGLTRITFPYIMLISIGALFMGILNAKRRFAASAFAPVLMNLGIIFACFVLARHFAHPAAGIAWGVIIGGTLQVLIQVPSLVRLGLVPRFNFNWKNPALKQIGRLMLPTMYGSAVYQFNLLAMTFLASYLPTGAVSYLYYADRITEFPLGLFAISLATVALPAFSEHVAAGDHGKMRATFRQLLGMVWILNIPAAVGLICLSQAIVALLFLRGGFTRESAELTAQSLAMFAIGLPFVSGSRIVANAFYALQEPKRPVIAANFTVLVNVLAGILLLKPMGHRGLALSVSLGAITNFGLLMYFYWRRVGQLGLKELGLSVGKICAATGLMALAVLATKHYWDWSFAPFKYRALYVMAMIAGGGVVYLAAAAALRVEGLELIARRVLRRR